MGGVNNLCDAFVGPINVTAEYVDRISKGDIPPKITDTYNGDFNEIKNNLNACIDTMSGLLVETDKLVNATVAGQLATRGDAAKFAGGWGKLVGGVNNLCDAFVGPINVTAEYVDRISKGDIPPKITDTYNGDFNEIKNNLNACIDTMSGLLVETDKLVNATVAGQLATRGDAAKFAGGWGKLVGGVNNLCDAFVGPINVTAEHLPSIVDVAGVNRIAARIYANAVGAIAGMVETRPPKIASKPLLAASMFGNTTPIVNRCVETMGRHGYETLVFHCTGTGGRTMEGLVNEGFIDGILDITTTEWADEIAGGVFTAGPTRGDAAAAAAFRKSSPPAAWTW